jgi:hypothetical protein
MICASNEGNAEEENNGYVILNPFNQSQQATYVIGVLVDPA